MSFKAYAVRNKRGHILVERTRSTWKAARLTITADEFKAGYRACPAIIIAMAHKELERTNERNVAANLKAKAGHCGEPVCGPGVVVASEDGGRVAE
jgi:hypothetical protein